MGIEQDTGNRRVSVVVRQPVSRRDAGCPYLALPAGSPRSTKVRRPSSNTLEAALVSSPGVVQDGRKTSSGSASPWPACRSSPRSPDEVWIASITKAFTSCRRDCRITGARPGWHHRNRHASGRHGRGGRRVTIHLRLRTGRRSSSHENSMPEGDGRSCWSHDAHARLTRAEAGVPVATHERARPFCATCPVLRWPLVRRAQNGLHSERSQPRGETVSMGYRFLYLMRFRVRSSEVGSQPREARHRLQPRTGAVGLPTNSRSRPARSTSPDPGHRTYRRHRVVGVHHEAGRTHPKSSLSGEHVMKRRLRTSRTRALSAAELDAMHDAGVGSVGLRWTSRRPSVPAVRFSASTWTSLSTSCVESTTRLDGSA